MVHTFGIPASASGLKHRAFSHFTLDIAGRGQCRDLKGTDLLAVKRRIVLGVADNAIAKHRHPSPWTGAMRVILDERILGMRLPRSKECVGIVETQRIVLERPTAHKHPPFPIRTKQRWVSVLPGEHLTHTGPGGWEINGSIDSNSLGF